MGSLMRWERRIYRILLRAYPRAFRERYGGDMEEAFVYLLRTKGSRRLTLWMGTLWDVTTGGLGERRRGGRPNGTGIGKGGAKRMETWFQDLKYGARTLWKNPGFHGYRRRDHRPGDRRQLGNLQRRRLGAARRSAVR